VKAVDAREQWSDIFSSPVYGQKIADWRPFPEDFRKCEVDFSALQTACGERDSNLRYSFATLTLDVSVCYRSQNPRREFRTKKPASVPRNQSYFDSPSIRIKRRTLSDSVARNGQFDYYSRPRLVSA
jgi:hypothetical protein